MSDNDREDFPNCPAALLAMVFAIFAFVLVLPACDGGIPPRISGDDTEIDVEVDVEVDVESSPVRLEVLVLPNRNFMVPACAPPRVGQPEAPNPSIPGSGCPEKHYHDAVAGFFFENPLILSFGTEFEPDGVGCGHGLKKDIDATRKMLRISNANLNDYENATTTPDRACWY
ncbi:MAG: hypothetical protein JRG94_22500 [Deltaproteobacteria bacterium]|nr:hypothetical protein [Deltaproteobacteria bacterium]MBW2716917.1 hypothetical protein [Deltaproteobacteria bacterium]